MSKSKLITLILKYYPNLSKDDIIFGDEFNMLYSISDIGHIVFNIYVPNYINTIKMNKKLSSHLIITYNIIFVNKSKIKV